jgi:hypothetical protein
MTLKIDGIDRVIRKLDNVSAFQRWANRPMTQTVALLQDTLAKYPAKAQGAFSAMATPRQKRAYWARVKSGAITHGPGGYRRTGTLGRKWTTKTEPTASGVKGTVGNNAPGAQFVQGDRQQPFHRASGFVTTRQARRDNEGKIQLVWRQAVRQVLTGR